MKSVPRKKTLQFATLVAAICATSVAHAQFAPIALTPESYNYDVVVERTAPGPLIPGGYTTASMDGGTNNNGDTWNEIGYFKGAGQEGVGLPAPGTTITSLADATLGGPTHQYTFAPSYTAVNDAIMLDANPVFTNVTITLNTPGAYAGLSFLTSGGNGGCIFSYTVHHADGTTETGQSPSADWFNGANPAIIANGRVNAQSFSLDNFNSNNPRLYGKDVTLANTTSPVTSIDLAYVSSASGAHTCIMAISGATTAGGNFAPILFSGYNADIVVEAGAAAPTPLVGVTTATFDGGLANTGFSVYEKGYVPTAPTTGLPAPGATVTSTASADHTYVLAGSYTTNDAVFVDTENSTATIVPVTPQAYSGLSFLASSGGGSTTLTYDISFQDGSVESGTAVIPDWFNNVPVALTLNGRVNLDTSGVDSLNGNNPRLYSVDFPLSNTTSAVTNIALTYSSGSRGVIFAVSGSTAAVKPSISAQPTPVFINSGSDASFTATVTGTEPVTYIWQKGTNGVFANLSDNGTISGSATTTLNFTGATANDSYDYRLIASNAGGSITSSVVSLTVLSTLPQITAPTDSVAGYNGSWPAAESPDHAIDNNTQKYLNSGVNGGSPFVGPIGFVVTPAKGRTVLGAIRFYTANDTPNRDPIDYTVEGSNDGGTTYAVIASGPLSLPDARNASGLALDLTTEPGQQVIINNTAAYTTYRVSFNHVKSDSTDVFQIGEVELLGNVDTSGSPFFSAQPTSIAGVVGGTVQLTATGSGTPAPTFQWLKGTNGIFAPLSNGGNISGAGTSTLTISGLSKDDATQYAIVASNTAGSATSSIVNVTVISSLQDVTSPDDTVSSFGEGDGVAASNPGAAIDNNTTKYVNIGSGFSASAGFPPFGGPVGIVVTPAAGSTIVSGLRVYTADGNPERDPVDYILEGSNDDGTTYTVLSSGTLTPPTARNAGGLAIDPLTQAMQEVLFPNSTAYTSYRLTFTHVRTTNAANALQVGEIELLGTTGTSGPSLTIQKGETASTVIITSSAPGTLQSTTSLVPATGWSTIGPINGSSTQQITGTAQFFRVVIP